MKVSIYEKMFGNETCVCQCGLNTIQSVKFLYIAYFIFESIHHDMQKLWQELTYLICIYHYHR